MSFAAARAQGQPETLGDKIKKLFVRPTPTPKPRKRRISAPATISATPTESTAGATSGSETPAISVEAQRTEPQGAQPQYFEPVRPISPGPRSRGRLAPHVTSTPKMTPPATAAPETTLTPTTTPNLTPLATETPPLRPTSSLPPLVKTSPTPIAKKTATAPTAISVGEIADSERYSPEIRKLIEFGLNLTTRNLGYKYVSADPTRGGMDSSGFIYYVLSNSGIASVPRDARDQYIWLRKAGTFQAVLAQRDDTFELDGLRPGDLLFWASNHGVSADPDITQTMIYAGRDKTTKQ
jgi:cell wall-associated NlpC family hydrolase